MYFDIPLCLPINISPGMVFPTRTFRSNTDVAQYAARFVTLAGLHHDKLLRYVWVVNKLRSHSLKDGWYFRTRFSGRIHLHSGVQSNQSE